MASKISRNSISFFITFLIFIYFPLTNRLHAANNIVGKDTISIAVVGPMMGRNMAKGQEMLAGIRMYADQINEQGGINGKKITLEIFDDRDSEETAREKAFEIKERSNALVVLGHRNSATCLAAGEIYKKSKIPIITGTATADEITKGNEWYFRTIPNNAQQGKLLAYYIKEILNHSRASIIYDEDPYGTSLLEAFEKTAQQIGITIQYRWSFQSDQRNLDDDLRYIVMDLSAKEDPGVIFLATHDVESVPIIIYMKEFDVDLPIIGGPSVGKQSFYKRFLQFPKEKENPGYYTDGVYASTYFIYDVASAKAQQFRHEFMRRYNKDPGAVSASSYDVAGIAIEAIKKTGSPSGNVEEDRERIRDYLAGLSSVNNAYKGITGHIYFDRDGNAVKSVTIGLFDSQKLISAPIQLNPITNLSKIAKLKRKYGSKDSKDRPKDILSIDNIYLQLAKVVYVGTEIIEISDLDLSQLTYSLDFYLWFRFKGDVDTGNIEFINAVEPIQMGNPIKNEVTGDHIYRLYRVKGRFRAFSPDSLVFRQHVLGYAFRHKDLPRENLIIVSDVLNMQLTSREALVNKMKEAQVLNAKSGWRINNASFYQDTMRMSSLGSPEYQTVKKGEIEYSRFNSKISIKKDEFALRGTIPYEYAIYVCLISAFVLFIPALAVMFKYQNIFSKSFLFIKAVFPFILLLSSEIIIIDRFFDNNDLYLFRLITYSYDVLWWIISASVLIMLIGRFLWTPLEVRTKLIIPGMVRRFLGFVIYLLAFFGIVAFVFDQKITSLLATSGVFAMIIGLAIQMNISNIFSGIALNLDRPFRVGDWVKIDSIEGQVKDVTWRATRVQTSDNCIESIPNSKVESSVIRNYNYPDDSIRIDFTVHVDPVHSPDHVNKILVDALLSVSEEGMLKEPAPSSEFKELTNWSADYTLSIFIKDYDSRSLISEEVWKRIWTHLNRAGISPAAQRQEIHMFRGVKERGPEEAARPEVVVQEMDIFSPFSDKARSQIAERMHPHRFPAGTTIVKQGDTGGSLYVIIEGVVGIWIAFEEGKPIEVARMGAGSFFGEMELLTGEPRTASVITIQETQVFEITKEIIAPVIRERPDVVQRISKIMKGRQLSNEYIRTSLVALKQEEHQSSGQILKKIRRFFELTGP